MGLFIADGFTLEGKIAAKGPLPALTYRYRPALQEQTHQYRYAFNTAQDGRGRLQAENKLILDALVSWDAVDDKGAAVPISSESLSRLYEAYRTDIINDICWGIEKQAEAEKN